MSRKKQSGVCGSACAGRLAPVIAEGRGADHSTLSMRTGAPVPVWQLSSQNPTPRSNARLVTRGSRVHTA